MDQIPICIAGIAIGYLLTEWYHSASESSYRVSMRTTTKKTNVRVFTDAAKNFYDIDSENNSFYQRVPYCGFHDNIFLQVCDPERSLQGAVLKVESYSPLYGTRTIMERTIDKPDCVIRIGGVAIRITSK